MWELTIVWKVRENWYQGIHISCEIHYMCLWNFVSPDTVQEMPGCFVRAEKCKAVKAVPIEQKVPHDFAGS